MMRPSQPFHLAEQQSAPPTLPLAAPESTPAAMVACPDCGGSGRAEGHVPCGESPRDYEDDCPACAGYGEMPWEFQQALIEGRCRLVECRLCGQVRYCLHSIFDLCAYHYTQTFYTEELRELTAEALSRAGAGCALPDEIPF